jgi:3-methyladenine DNA glycosylase AlkC
MAEPLKNIYSKAFIDELTAALKKAYPILDTNRFTKLVFSKDWPEKELKQRMRHIAETMKQVLPENFNEAVAVIIRCIEMLRENRPGEMYFEYMFFPDFIELYGMEELETSITAMEKITQFTSAEFAVRPFLINYPERMKEQMYRWSSHPHPMVRRLSTEGFRPRLPWAMAVPYLKKDPAVILPVLEKLKEDESETVRRSVANNLNDIAKDHPEIVLRLIAEWNGKSKETDWVIRHGSRSLLKRGNKGALKHFGLEEAKGVKIENLKTEKKKIKIGNTLHFSFSLFVKNETKLRIEYGIDFVKANGKTSRKIFKLSEGVYEKGSFELKRKQSFKDFTTRKHYPGKHTVAILINGKEMAIIEFILTK